MVEMVYEPLGPLFAGTVSAHHQWRHSSRSLANKLRPSGTVNDTMESGMFLLGPDDFIQEGRRREVESGVGIALL